IRLTRRMPFETNIRRVQDLYYDVLQTTYSAMEAKAHEGEASAIQWLAHFRAAGELLRVRTPALAEMS
ncbi:MAG: hypothetical protein ACKV22_39735, partial [Bryobacteraceae bacterium]